MTLHVYGVKIDSLTKHSAKADELIKAVLTAGRGQMLDGRVLGASQVE